MPDSINIDLGGLDFLKPYILREFGEDSTPIFDKYKFIKGNPTISLLTAPFPSINQEDNKALLLLPNVVATGMNGTARELLNDVASGRFISVRDFTFPEFPVIHGLDVARAVKIISNDFHPKTYYLSDQTLSTVEDVAQAFAARLENKRILTVPKKWAKLFGINRRWRKYSFKTPDCPIFSDIFNFEPIKVCEYLSNHDYTTSDL